MDEAGTVAAGTTLRGTLRGSGAVRVEGRIEGELVLDDDALVAPGGRVEGAIRARAVDVVGRVDGRIETGRLDLRATARVAADLTATALTIEDGAAIHGYIRMQLDLPDGLGEGTR